jgi:peptide subunit release factor 1 (eRF1)
LKKTRCENIKEKNDLEKSLSELEKDKGVICYGR